MKKNENKEKIANGMKILAGKDCPEKRDMIESHVNPVYGKVKTGFSLKELEMMEYSNNRQKAHIDAVCKNLEKIAEMIPSCREQLEKRMKLHDQSKFTEPEFTPYLYINWMYKCKKEGIPYVYPDGIEDKTHEATEHHVLNNSHHPEYHAGEVAINKDDRDKSDKAVDASKMSDIDVIEMVCDWVAVSKERGTNSARDWYNKNSGTRWLFTDGQKDFIDSLLTIFEGEDI